MSVVHPTAIRNQLADLACGLVDAGNGPGVIVFLTSGNVEVATLTFSNPAFLPAQGGTAIADTITADESATGGTVAKASIRDSDDNEVFACSVSVPLAGGDIALNSLVISVGQEVTMSALSYTASL